MINNTLTFVGSGFLIVADGDGRRQISQTAGKPDTMSTNSTKDTSKGEILDLLTETLACTQPSLQRPVLLLADSMGRCIPATDSVILPVIKPEYRFDQMAEDIAAGAVSLSHRFVVIWAGARSVADPGFKELMVDLKALLNIVRIKNREIQVFVSTVIPQPRDQRNLQSRIATFNNELRGVVAEFQGTRTKVGLLQSHLIYLDEQLDIIRPIVDNFEDGFHLNLHGAHRLRQFWLSEMGLSK